MARHDLGTLSAWRRHDIRSVVLTYCYYESYHTEISSAHESTHESIECYTGIAMRTWLMLVDRHAGIRYHTQRSTTRKETDTMDDKEITAMMQIAKALGQFDEEEQTTLDRILKWCLARYGSRNIGQHAVVDETKGKEHSKRVSGNELTDFADLFDACVPRTAPERALVAGYWVTVGENQTEFPAQAVNSKLKDLGYGVRNITDALSSLQKRTPSLVMQTAKQGTSRQARKRYKLTVAGHEEVQGMVHADRVSSDQGHG